VVKGKLEPRADDKNILVEEVVSLRDARTRFIKRVIFKVSTAGLEDDLVGKIHRLCADHPGPCRLFFHITTPTHGDYTLATGQKVVPTDKLIADAETLLGRGAVELHC
jgi:hypothetical protein